MNNKVHEKGYRNKPLTDQQKANNKEKSKTRARVEHAKIQEASATLSPNLFKNTIPGVL